MRLLDTTPDQPAAQRFGDYLLTLKIPNAVEAMAEGFGVWIERDDDLDRARGEWHAFRQNPSDPRYVSASSAASRIRKQETAAEEKRRRNYVDVRTSQARTALRPRPITVALIALSLLATFGTNFGKPPTGNVLNWLRFAELRPVSYDAGGQVDVVTWSVRRDLSRGQVWRPITPIFTHFSGLHLVFNLYWLFILGSAIEARRGWVAMAVLCLLGAIIPNTAQYLWDGPMFGGMSGVTYALSGYVWLKGKLQPHHGLGLDPQSATILAVWLALGFTGLVGPIANMAHLFGLGVGLAYAYAESRLRPLNRLGGRPA